MKPIQKFVTAAILCGVMLFQAISLKAENVREELAGSRFKLVHESYVNNNWELFVTSADGKSSVNLTNTPGVNELYPQASPDGSRICFLVDSGTGRATVRSLWVMNADGTGRKKVVHQARQPCWAPDGETIAFLPQEYPKFNVTDYYTKGISFHHLPSGKTREHVNTKPLHHLYNISYAPNGKWIVATVHAGMGHRHTNLLIEANGSKIIDLGIDGCRPTFSPDGKHIAWGAGDHELAVVPIDIDSDNPKLGKKVFQVFDKQNKIYHVDWSPNGRVLSFCRGPNGKGDLTKPGTYAAACEIVGVHAKGWDIFAVQVAKGGSVTIGHKPVYEWMSLTRNGHSNKESDWFLPPSK